MNDLKSIEELKELLLNFEQEITKSIAASLQRIGGIVDFTKLEPYPFNEDIKYTYLAVRLVGGDVLLDTPFKDEPIKYLSDCLSDHMFHHWALIELLEILEKINE